MQKSGYFQKTGCIAYDSDGKPHMVIELHIQGDRFAIRLADLARALAGRIHVQVESLAHNWKYYLGSVGGLAQVSGSGKALNIDLFSGGSFTVSLKSLRAVMYGRDRSAVVVKIPEDTQNHARQTKYPYGQQKISVKA
ncbi:MAG: hypothetical protein OS112_09320 [Methanoregula sp.]|nr:MAG: hypothetical protein OS112_09320 [Methanoregula sp.]